LSIKPVAKAAMRNYNLNSFAGPFSQVLSGDFWGVNMSIKPGWFQRLRTSRMDTLIPKNTPDFAAQAFWPNSDGQTRYGRH